MCGISGIVCLKPDTFVQSSELQRMNEVLDHRGPDGQGLWLSPHHRIGFGHSRLAIVDLNPLANQPMSDQSEDVWLTFNGEIYNAPTLRDELERAGCVFQTDHSDTEVILQAYKLWGIHQTLNRLDGIFAFALHDMRTNATFFVRDKLGVKPLYLCVDKGRLYFASEIKAILACTSAAPRMSHAGFYHYLTYLCAPAPLTMFEGVYKIPAATILVAQGEKLSTTQYWSAADALGGHCRLDEDGYIRRTRQLVSRAIDKQMCADVEVGAFLSGGVDSSSIVALMSQMGKKSVNTFTVSYEDHTHLNEVEHAELVARTFKSNHFNVVVNKSRMQDYIGKLSYQQDEPIADWVCIPLHFVAEEAKSQNTKVVLVGEGADELFCGYEGYIRALQRHESHWRRFRSLPGVAQKLVASLAQLLAGGSIRSAAYADYAHRAAYDREQFWSGATLFTETAKALLVDVSACEPDIHPETIRNSGLLDPLLDEFDSYNVIRQQNGRLAEYQPDADLLAQMTYRELHVRLAELLLMRVDKITMASSIEARVPFLDQDLVKFAFSIPQNQKIPNWRAKHLLKEAAAEWLPEQIIQRPKMGFGAPMSDWLREDFGLRVRDTILDSTLLGDGLLRKEFAERIINKHRKQHADYGVFIWALFNLCQWQMEWRVHLN